jgi:hypothetical protein
MANNKLKPVRCDNCKFFEITDEFREEGVCEKDGNHTRGHRVCNKLSTDADRRDAKIRRNG